MMDYAWIKECGELEENRLVEHIGKYLEHTDKFMACSTDSFTTGHGAMQELSNINVTNLLELRLFSEKREICYRRSSIGCTFQWRLADEDGLDKQSYIERYQTLDINQDRTSKAGNAVDQSGNKILYTTGGGRYALPLDEEADSTKIIVYVAYDESGMAKAVDYRVAGFVNSISGKNEVG